MKKNIFRLSILLLSVFLFSFTNREALKNSNSLKGDETSRRFWGWGCPSCTFTGMAANGTEMNFSCTSSYYVMGVAVSFSTPCECTVVSGSAEGCPSCNQGNLDCGGSLQP